MPKHPVTTGAVSWETHSIQFQVPLSPLRGGGLPLQLVVELWEVYEQINARDGDTMCSDYSSSVAKKTEHSSPCTQQRLLGTVTVGPDTLLLRPPGRLSLPLVPPSNLASLVIEKMAFSKAGVALAPSSRVGGGNKKKTLGGTSDNESRAPRIVLRITPQVGLYWGRRVMSAAGAAKRAQLGPQQAHPPDFNACTTCVTSASIVSEAEPRTHGDQVSVIHMTNAEGSARTWRAPVTPGNSFPRIAYGDVVELTYGSIPACCPQAPNFVVAPFSDIGVQLGGVWVGPPVAARHAIVAHRPSQIARVAGNDGAKAGDGFRAESGSSCVDGNKGYEVAGGEVESPPEDELFMRTVAAEAEGLLRELRAKEMRMEQRRLALERVRAICNKWDSTRVIDGGGIEEEEEKAGVNGTEEVEGDFDDKGNSNSDKDDDDDDNHSNRKAHGELYRRFLRALEMALPGVSVYLGLLESGAKVIRYVACTRSSSMVGNILKRDEGISFSCVGPRYLPSIIYPPQRDSMHGASFSTDRHMYHRPSCSEEGWLLTDDMGHSDAGSPLIPQASGADVAPQAKGTEAHSNRAKIAGESIPTTESAIAATYGGDSSVIESSEVEGAVVAKNSRRGKLDQNRVINLQQQQQQQQRQQPVETSEVDTLDDTAHPSPLESGQCTSRSTESAPSTRPKVFDYDGRVGWPFVCVPLEGSLGTSSIGVLGMDTFEQMGGDRRGSEQPEAGVVQAVAEAARFEIHNGGGDSKFTISC